MADTIVLYASSVHLNSMLLLAKFIAKHHHQSIHVTILCNAPTSAAVSVADVPSITYHNFSDPPPPNHDNGEVLFEISRLNNQPLLEAIQEISKKSRIRAFVIDVYCNPAFEVCKSLNIPTYFYVSSGGFSTCLMVYLPSIHEIVRQDLGTFNDFIEIPGCPPIHSSDFPRRMHSRESNFYENAINTGINSRKSDGILVNSFDAFEIKAKEALLNDLCTPNAKTPPVYFLGPLIAVKQSNNGSVTVTGHECLKWLDLQPIKSVIYLCFGRWGLFSAEQLKEMAVGLENSGHRFLWAARSPPSQELDAILPQRFLERTKDRGFVLKSWAPQKEILSHESVAGFVTHCGRSSVLESVSFGVLMICWPLYAEQKMNRVYMVEEWKVALPLEMGEDGFVTAAELEKRVRELMESEKRDEVRRRVAEMRNAGEAAAEEKGGSSVMDLEKFIMRVVIK